MKQMPRQQRGMTLLIALIMLVLMTLFAATGFNLGKSSLQMVGNMQQRNQTITAAQSAIEQALSTTKFFQTPSAVYWVPCAGPNTLCFDVNGSGLPDVTVTLTPNPLCMTAKTVQNASLDLTKSNDAGCALGVAQTFGVVGSAATGNSLCADSMWEINAVAVDNIARTQATLTQGVMVRVSTDDVAASCP